MKFAIVTDTAGSRVGELATELRDILEPKILEKYINVDFSLLIAIRCLPESYNRKTSIRYYKKNRELILDIATKVEDYIKLYKIEQRFNLGNIFIHNLRQAFKTRSIKGLDRDALIKDIIKWGSESEKNWFCDEIDWSSDLDK